jgi:hypothetical protein
MLEIPTQMNDAITGATSIPDDVIYQKTNETLQN